MTSQPLSDTQRRVIHDMALAARDLLTREAQERILQRTSSGGVCFNDVVMHVGVPELPFGGVGNSGMGSYHGEAGFRTFSHERSVLRRPFRLDVPFRYPPYAGKLPLLASGERDNRGYRLAVEIHRDLPVACEGVPLRRGCPAKRRHR